MSRDSEKTKTPITLRELHELRQDVDRLLTLKAILAQVVLPPYLIASFLAGYLGNQMPKSWQGDPTFWDYLLHSEIPDSLARKTIVLSTVLFALATTVVNELASVKRHRLEQYQSSR